MHYGQPVRGLLASKNIFLSCHCVFFHVERHISTLMVQFVVRNFFFFFSFLSVPMKILALPFFFIDISTSVFIFYFLLLALL